MQRDNQSSDILTANSEKYYLGTSLVVQGLSLCASTVRGKDSIPVWGTKIPLATWPSRKKKKKEREREVLLCLFMYQFSNYVWRAGFTGPSVLVLRAPALMV